MKTEKIGDEIVITLEKLINLCLDYGLVADEKRRQICYELLETAIRNEIRKGLKQEEPTLDSILFKRPNKAKGRTLFKEKWGNVEKHKQNNKEEDSWKT